MAQLSLFLVILLALVIPIWMARFKISNVPTAVAEIVTGIIMGASGFNLIQPTHDLTFLRNVKCIKAFGIIFLNFISFGALSAAA